MTSIKLPGHDYHMAMFHHNSGGRYLPKEPDADSTPPPAHAISPKRGAAPLDRGQKRADTDRSAVTRTEAAAPPSFVARLRAIVDSAEARGRQYQAIALACESRCDVAEARRVLSTLPTDEARGFGAGDSIFPGASVALDPEAARVATIMRLPEAAGRERAALELASTGLPASQVAQLLAAIPVVSEARIPTIAERAEGMAEFGDSMVMPGASRGKSKVDDMWSDVIAKANGGQVKTNKRDDGRGQ